RQGSIASLGLLRRRLLVSLEIPSQDKSHAWFLQWMATHKNYKTQKLSVETSFKQHSNQSVSTNFSLVPGPGKHYFKYKGAWMQVERQRNGKMVNIQSGAPWEAITLTTLSRDRELFKDLLAEARELALAKNEGKTVVYTSYGPDWRPFGLPRKRKPLESVILDKDQKERIVTDVKDFLSNGEWYLKRGIPYRRGYLLHGPPGSGKSSFIQALAGELQFNICILNLSERGLTDDRLNHLMTVVPERSLLLLEDIDAAFVKRDATEKQGYQSMVTFSGLLNALDGVAAAEERIVFMTTNHIERLDPALVRPGRVDVKELLDNVSAEQMKKLFLRFYQGEEDLANKFVAKLQGLPVSAASLQGHFVFYKQQPQQALDNVDKFIQNLSQR
ncbi:hypothetical protein CONCODRAFT_45084, partial [Conidiobolus coronatus NRRL 28638]